MAQYSPLNGETIYDIAIKLYNDVVAGVSDLLSLNPQINIDADLFGTQITYTPGLKRTKPVIINPPIPTVQDIYSVRLNQSVYDLAIQLYGDLSNIGKLLEIFSNLNDEVTFGSQIPLDKQDDPVIDFFKNKVVATFERPEIISHLTFDSTLVKWDTALYTWDNN